MKDSEFFQPQNICIMSHNEQSKKYTLNGKRLIQIVKFYNQYV